MFKFGAFLVLTFSAVLGQVLDGDLEKDEILSYKSLDGNPFRMQKVNLLWDKARKTLTEGKLKLLYSALKVMIELQLKVGVVISAF